MADERLLIDGRAYSSLNRTVGYKAIFKAAYSVDIRRPVKKVGL